jgi:hypothetical protein
MKNRNLFCLLFLFLNLHAEEKIKTEPKEIDPKILAALGYKIKSFQITAPIDAKKVSCDFYFKMGSNETSVERLTCGFNTQKNEKVEIVNCFIMYKIEGDKLLLDYFIYELGGKKEFSLTKKMDNINVFDSIELDEKGRLVLFYEVTEIKVNNEIHIQTTKENSTVDGAKSVFYVKFDFK